MKYNPTPLEGAYTIELEPRADERGFFSRVYCENEFSTHGLETHYVQFNTSFTQKKHTLRGMHYQLGDSAEVKVIKCIRGSLFDVILDLRQDSETFGKWFGAELSDQNRKMMYVPRGFAHGFQALTDDVEMMYFVSNTYSATNERSVRWNDPKFSIDWPFEPVMISEKDASARDFETGFHLGKETP
ncbi:dTDP-4-dehydrorhamnose 3,5-epimerase [Asticcacaulis benevestitus]|uniref:dTDP-4-dehydrorhamnose 3,5-epimerase n=1 Tax=Asticcacaulis benevestitus DSM 16100 = ATCC BAA-896 TaxID=1121022 RepID=V4RDF2_9CAUL|nr:dTDP-4-dehydrorhamnose 3,5-epimerase [Asticcacaulis benevestitus]ESQ89438.1 hypothetical protein ABENE_13750 [Asticcacaulis benevestitus DSM 16100 = ATCC BAA-896]